MGVKRLDSIESVEKETQKAISLIADFMNCHLEDLTSDLMTLRCRRTQSEFRLERFDKSFHSLTSIWNKLNLSSCFYYWNEEIGHYAFQTAFKSPNPNSELRISGFVFFDHLNDIQKAMCVATSIVLLDMWGLCDDNKKTLAYFFPATRYSQNQKG